MKIPRYIAFIMGSFAIGWLTCFYVNTDSIDSFKYKNELIDAQYDALEIADSLLLENNLYNREYLKAYNKVDSLYWETL